MAAEKLRHRTAFDSGEIVLSAFVPSDSQLTNLSSKVKPIATLAANPALASWITKPVNLRGLYGAVGSEAEIVDSTLVPGDATVTMQWRKRRPSESHAPNALPSPGLPEGERWLASDVVKIGGIDSTVAYALQMTFDNRINLALLGPVDGLVENQWSNLYLSRYEDNRWEMAGDSGLGNFQSLADFLDDNAGVDLSDLVGNWGVDPLTSDTGIGHAWAIVSGSGVFAVDPAPRVQAGGTTAVPEPGTLPLLTLAALGLLALRRRKC